MLSNLQAFTIWFGESEETADYIRVNTVLAQRRCTKKQMYVSSSPKFAENPELIKGILYLDRPDVIVTAGFPEQPVVGVEISAEAMSGHDVFQRFGRIVAAVEHGVPFAYMFPYQKWVRRKTSARWDFCNPLIFRALLYLTRIHGIPALPFIWEAHDNPHSSPHGGLRTAPSRSCLPDPSADETKALFSFVNMVIKYFEARKPFIQIINTPFFADRERLMWKWYYERGGDGNWAPLTSTEHIDTRDLITIIKEAINADIELPEFVLARPKTILYKPHTQTFRGDPYAGSLLAIDYLCCRDGPTVRHRHTNLGLWFPRVSITELINKAKTYHRNTCALRYNTVEANANRFYTLHLRDGCRYTKQKEIRMFCAIADIVIFKDGVIL